MMLSRRELMVGAAAAGVALGATERKLFDGDSGAAAADGAMRRRVTEMMAAVRVFFDHPTIGVGPGMFKAYSEEYGNQDDAMFGHTIIPELREAGFSPGFCSCRRALLPSPRARASWA